MPGQKIRQNPYLTNLVNTPHMKTKFLILPILLFPFLSSFGQGFTAPSSGKAVVYFVRPATAGFAISFDFYDNDKFIGSFAGRNYMRYETDPGEHLFWATSENNEFMPAELAAGSTYVVLVNVEMGIAVARVGLIPLTPKDGRFNRVVKLVNKKASKSFADEELAERNASRAAQIRETLDKYEEKWKDKRTYNHLTADMSIPADQLIASSEQP